LIDRNLTPQSHLGLESKQIDNMLKFIMFINDNVKNNLQQIIQDLCESLWLPYNKQQCDAQEVDVQQQEKVVWVLLMTKA